MTNNFNSLIKLKAILIIILTQNIFASGSDKYRIVWNKDPETCITIGWDQVQGENPIVYFGDEDFGDDWEKYPRSQMPTRILGDSYGMNTHFAEIENLKPDQSYYFVIKDSKERGN